VRTTPLSDGAASLMIGTSLVEDAGAAALESDLAAAGGGSSLVIGPILGGDAAVSL
jgi:hypothetical protein